MPKKQEMPTPRETQILRVLWESGEASVRQVYEELHETENLAQNTIQTSLRIMETKGLVKHRLEGRTFIYRALHTRERTLAGFVDRVFGGAADQLVATLLRAKSLSEDEIAAIDDMIREAREKAPADE